MIILAAQLISLPLPCFFFYTAVRVVFSKISYIGDTLVVWRLGLHAFIAEGLGSTKTLPSHIAWPKKGEKKRKRDFTGGLGLRLHILNRGGWDHSLTRELDPICQN